MFEEIEAIIFDLDGVLVDSRHLHFEALNAALAEEDSSYVITTDEHLAKYDGRSTKHKLDLLTKEKGLPQEVHGRVWAKKQQHTVSLIDTCIKPDMRLREVLQSLAPKKLFCASNAIRSTVEAMLSALGIRDLFVYVYSNEDVPRTKPHPNIYLRCMADYVLVPQTTLIVEDSPIGRLAASLSGAHLMEVSGPLEVSTTNIQANIEKAEQQNRNRMQSLHFQWRSKVQVVIPMAGLGSRFFTAGYALPKPLIDVAGKPMIQWVIENLHVPGSSFVFVVRKEHLEHPEWNLANRLERLAPGCKIAVVDKLTEGPACTVFAARDYLDMDTPLLIANSDQFIEWGVNDIHSFLYEARNVDGSISVFHQPDPLDTKWSYASTDEDGWVVDVREKVVISTMASTGIYYWSKAGDFFIYATKMMDQGDHTRVNGEYYVAPCYKEAIADGKKIKTHTCKKMWGLGVPADLCVFLKEYLGINEP